MPILGIPLQTQTPEINSNTKTEQYSGGNGGQRRWFASLWTFNSRRATLLTFGNKIMCYFATIAISSTTSQQIGIPKRRGFHLFTYQNPQLAKALPSGLSTLAFTLGGCSCDICKPLGEDKIRVSLRADAADFLQDIIKSYGDVYLFIHWYSGDISAETFSPEIGREVTLDQIRSIPFQPDQLTKIKKPNKAVHPTATRVTLPAGRSAPGRKRATGIRG